MGDTFDKIVDDRDMDEYLKDDAFGLTDELDTEAIDDAPEYVYSVDEEFFIEDIDELDLGDAEDGDRIVIYRGTPVKVTHMDFLKDISLVEILQDAAYEEDGEMAEDYMTDLNDEDEAEMMKEINKIVCKYASQPNYHRVENITPITIVVGEFDE